VNGIALTSSSLVTISLSQKISIMNIANSEFAFIIGTDSTREKSRESTHELSMLWGLRWLFPLPHYTPLNQLHDSVQGGEAVHIERVRMITTGQAIYHQVYVNSSRCSLGLTSTSGLRRLQDYVDFRITAWLPALKWQVRSDFLSQLCLCIDDNPSNSQGQKAPQPGSSSLHSNSDCFCLLDWTVPSSGHVLS
jgi:hypothetical protein